MCIIVALSLAALTFFKSSLYIQHLGFYFSIFYYVISPLNHHKTPMEQMPLIFYE